MGWGFSVILLLAFARALKTRTVAAALVFGTVTAVQIVAGSGDLVLISSPGGDLGQSVIMGEFIRAHGLVTAVGTSNTSAQIRPGSVAVW